MRIQERNEICGKRKEGIGKGWKFKTRAYSGLIKRKVKEKEMEQGKTWEFLIRVYMRTKKEKGETRKEGREKDTEISGKRKGNE